MAPISDDEIKGVDLKKLLSEQLQITKDPTAEKIEVQSTSSSSADPEKVKKLEVLRAKVKVVARMNRIFKTLRSN